MKILLVLCFLLAAVVLLPGCTQFGNRDSIDIQNHTDSYINNKSNSSYLGSFTDKGGKTCAVDGKPIIRMYSTTWCPHCRWIKNTFDRVMKEYMDANKIIAHHWEIESINGT
ncbi:MAG: thioredoxin family protein, partial [Candidatus Micrarchaeia archaeon]